MAGSGSHSRPEVLERCEALSKDAAEAQEFLRLAREERDPDFEAECAERLNEFWSHAASSLVEAALEAPLAAADCFLELYSGEGGVDAMDWCQLLGGMYEEWSAAQGLAAERVSEVLGEAGGCRSLTVHISGAGAAGLLAGEAGVHRLIRISPFDRKGRRHTSFAVAVVVADADGGKTGDFNTIPKKDLKIETMRSSGPGGQSVNVSDTAVRVTHLPTGTTVKCQRVSSQGDNMRTAMKWLAAKLEAQAAAEQRRDRMTAYADGALDASAASERRVRTYTLHPQELVKDHRFGLQSRDASTVLSGAALQPFLEGGVLYGALQQLDAVAPK